MNKKDIERAVDAFRRNCPHNTLCKRLDGTITPNSCFEWDAKKHNYRCEGYICKRLRKYINQLKEPEQ